MSTPLTLPGQPSVTGRTWVLDEAQEPQVAQIAREQCVPDVVARVMAARGVAPEDAGKFLRPTFKEQFPDPFAFHDMEKAVEIILQAVEEQTPVTVFADYDVDGATSSAQLRQWFRALGLEADLYVPDRLTEGYGPNPQAFEKIAASGAELVITVDCGAVSHDAIAHARKLGLTVIVLDHHLMGEGEMPPANALVNPNRPDEVSEHGNLAAAGLVFVLLAALNQRAREAGLFNGKPEPNLLELAELAALGTVCDVARLTGFNRVLVAQGLRAMGNLSNDGLRALAEVSEAEPPFSTYHAGFVLGPRINAGGRIGASDLGARLLASTSQSEITDISHELDRLNVERKEIERRIQEEAETLAERKDDPVIVVAGENWHPGVIGIVAGRLKERFNRPTVVIATEDGIGHGSGRSVSGVNLGAAFGAAAKEGILIKGGGHAMAGGLSIHTDKIPDLRAFLNERLGAKVTEVTRERRLHLAAIAGLDGVSLELARSIALLEPFGMGNPEPLFAFPNARITWAQELKGGHVRCQLETETGSASISGICFRARERGLADALLDNWHHPLAVAAKVRVDRWQGRERIGFQIEDVALA